MEYKHSSITDSDFTFEPTRIPTIEDFKKDKYILIPIILYNIIVVYCICFTSYIIFHNEY